MNRFLLLLLFGAAAALYGQETTLTLGVRGPITADSPVKFGLYVLSGTKYEPVSFGSEFRLDTSVNPAQLRCSVPSAPAPATITIREVEELPSKLTADLPTYLLAETPKAFLTIIHQGYTLKRGLDYNVSGRVVTFLAGAIPWRGSEVQFRYLVW